MCRVPDVNVVAISRVLDLGVRGVMILRMETREQMQEEVKALKYAPEGHRGVALGVAHDLYRAGGPSFFAEANADTMVIAIIETAKGLENIEIVSVPGLDVAWMEHYDLTVSMGIPAQFDHPRFLAAMDAIVATSRKYGVAAGFMVATPQEAIHWIGEGFHAISLGSHGSRLRTFARLFVDALARSAHRHYPQHSATSPQVRLFSSLRRERWGTTANPHSHAPPGLSNRPFLRFLQLIGRVC
jgi:2-dehydro-3-deoxyglucarate aldolase/4-hydroxy-2-oxoheptanedioate aldolase